MNNNRNKSKTCGFNLGANTHCNENQDRNMFQYSENIDQTDELQQEMKTIQCPPNLQQELYQGYLTQFYICESCNNSYKLQKQYMVYQKKDGAWHCYSNNIYSLNEIEEKAILCRHFNKIDLENLSDDEFGKNPLQNRNIKKIQEVFQIFQLNIQENLQQQQQIEDVSICKICIDYANPEDVDYYIIQHIQYGVITKDPNDIYQYNPGEVLAISCPHNQLKLRNFSKDIGHILLRKYPKTFDTYFKNNPGIYKKYFQNLGTQGHFKIKYFNKLCKDEKLRELIIKFFRIKLYPLLIKSKIDTQNLRTSAFLVNIMHYIKVLSDPSKKLKRNVEN